MAIPGRVLKKMTNTKLKLSDLNPHLMCVLCGGYYIDATTIVECLHSFCRSCIVKHLEGSKYCPICEVQVHKTKPLINIRPDKTLQDIVYKLVPGLFANEMRNRRRFYEERPHYIKPNDSEAVGEVSDDQRMFVSDENITFTLTYLDGPSPVPIEDNYRELTGMQKEIRYFKCPTGVTIHHLKKLLRAKYELRGSQFKTVIFLKDEALNDEYSLLDISYIYLWKTKEDLHMTYKIYENLAKRQKVAKKKTRLTEEMGVDIQPPEVQENVETFFAISPTRLMEPTEHVTPTESTQPADFVEPTQAAELVDTTQRIAFVEPIQHAERTESTQTVEFAEPVQHVEPTQPAGLAEPTQPAEFAQPIQFIVLEQLPQPTELVEPTQSTGLEIPTQTTEFAEPTQPTELAEATQHTGLAESTQHTGLEIPTQTTEFAEPTQPTELAEVTQHTGFAESAQSVELAEHTEPTQHTEFVEPIQHAEPVESIQPAEIADPTHAIGLARLARAAELAEPTRLLGSTEPIVEKIPRRRGRRQKRQLPLDSEKPQQEQQQVQEPLKFGRELRSHEKKKIEEKPKEIKKKDPKTEDEKKREKELREEKKRQKLLREQEEKRREKELKEERRKQRELKKQEELRRKQAARELIEEARRKRSFEELKLEALGSEQVQEQISEQEKDVLQIPKEDPEGVEEEKHNEPDKEDQEKNEETGEKKNSMTLDLVINVEPESVQASPSTENGVQHTVQEEPKEVQLQISESGVMSVSPVRERAGEVRTVEETSSGRVTRRQSLSDAAPRVVNRGNGELKAGGGGGGIGGGYGGGQGEQVSRKTTIKASKPAFKTIRSSPKAWNPIIPREKLRPTLMTNPDEPRKFFKARSSPRSLPRTIQRNIPTFLGNPTSGVKPMYGKAAPDDPEQIHQSQVALRGEREERRIVEYCDRERQADDRRRREEERRRKEDDRRRSEEEMSSLGVERQQSEDIHKKIVKIDPKTLRPLEFTDERNSKSVTPGAGNLLTNPFIPNNNHFLFSDQQLPPNSGNLSRSTESSLGEKPSLVGPLGGIGVPAGLGGGFNTTISNGSGFPSISFPSPDPSRNMFPFLSPPTQSFPLPSPESLDPLLRASHLAPFSTLPGYIPGFHASLPPSITQLMGQPFRRISVLPERRAEDESKTGRSQSCDDNVNMYRTDERARRRKRKDMETVVTNFLKSKEPKREREEGEEEEGDDDEKIFEPDRREERKEETNGDREIPKEEKQITESDNSDKTSGAAAAAAVVATEATEGCTNKQETKLEVR